MRVATVVVVVLWGPLLWLNNSNVSVSGVAASPHHQLNLIHSQCVMSIMFLGYNIISVYSPTQN